MSSKQVPTSLSPPCDVIIVYHHDDSEVTKELQERVHEAAPDATCRLYDITEKSAPHCPGPGAFHFALKVWLVVSDKLESCDRLKPVLCCLKKRKVTAVFTKPTNGDMPQIANVVSFVRSVEMTDTDLNATISRLLTNEKHRNYKQKLMEHYEERCKASTHAHQHREKSPAHSRQPVFNISIVDRKGQSSQQHDEEEKAATKKQHSGSKAKTDTKAEESAVTDTLKLGDDAASVALSEQSYDETVVHDVTYKKDELHLNQFLERKFGAETTSSRHRNSSRPTQVYNIVIRNAKVVHFG